jgi:hypothetical protein
MLFQLFIIRFCDWFYIRQTYFVALIGSMGFYNKLYYTLLYKSTALMLDQPL